MVESVAFCASAVVVWLMNSGGSTRVSFSGAKEKSGSVVSVVVDANRSKPSCGSFP